MDSLRSKVGYTALASRAAVILLSVISNAVLPDHAPVEEVFSWTESPTLNASRPLDSVVNFLTSGLTRWDGQYFLHIANNGYSYENTLAFFPLYPVTIRAVADVLYWMQVDYGLMHYASSLRLSAVLVNVVAFVAAALALYELSRRVLKDERLAYKSALYFCVNPASIFFSAAYTESMHAALSFAAMLKVERGFTIKMGLLLAASSGVRSNALLNLGFPLYRSMKAAARELAVHCRLKQLEHSDLSETAANLISDAFIPALLCAVMSVSPFALFQWYGFTEFCSVTKPQMDFDEAVINYGVRRSLKLPSSLPVSDWCHGRIPMPYGYIQDKYWNVGFLRYFELRQLPNFILAAPVIYLVLTQAARFVRCHRYYAHRLGCTYFNLDPAAPRVPAHDTYRSRVLPKDAFVYVVHAVALALFGLFFAHVQISTRMIMSSSPLPYWIAALLTSSPDTKPVPLVNPEKPATVTSAALLSVESKDNLEHAWRNAATEERISRGNKEGRSVRNYFFGYAVIGTVLFANMLPWT